MKNRGRICIQESMTGNGTKIAILNYVGEDDPVQALDEAVLQYTNGHDYTEFIDMNMDNPWVRVIIEGNTSTISKDSKIYDNDKIQTKI